MATIAFAIILFCLFVFVVGVGLLLNVYLYKNHALRTLDAHNSLDNQLFVYYGDVDTREVW